MNAWEEKLREALRRKAAPEGFAERVLARTRELPEPAEKPWERLRAFFAKPALRWAAVGALCLVIASGAVYRERQERQRREGELARRQVKQALRIASVKLNVALRKVQGINQGAPQSRL